MTELASCRPRIDVSIDQDDCSSAIRAIEDHTTRHASDLLLSSHLLIRVSHSWCAFRTFYSSASLCTLIRQPDCSPRLHSRVKVAWDRLDPQHSCRLVWFWVHWRWLVSIRVVRCGSVWKPFECV